MPYEYAALRSEVFKEENQESFLRVLISFTDERVGVNSSGEPDRFGRAMEQLGDRLLAAIDDGKFDPTV